MGKNSPIEIQKRIITQQGRCQLCFENPSRPKHLTISIANFTYLMLPSWEPFVTGHCYILPMQHVASARNLDDNEWEELRNFKKCLLRMYAEEGKDVIFIETAMGLAQQRRHCWVECIPLPNDIAKEAPLYFKKVFRDNQSVQERIMDSNALWREQGITILSKNTAICYKDTKINVIDTPAHSDFGGEVERVLNMVEDVLLVVDSVEGQMPQTRFVLKKALELGLSIIVVVNKIDRPSARPDHVVNATFELFIELNATDEQCDFQVIYASGVKGQAGLSPEKVGNDLGSLFEPILRVSVLGVPIFSATERVLPRVVFLMILI